MKRLIFISTLLLFSTFSIKAQYVIAGTPGAVYVDLSPDTTVASTIANVPDKYYFIDINQDGMNDVEIVTRYSYMSLHSQLYHKDVGVYSQNASTSFFQGNYTYSTACESHSSGTYTYTPHNTTLLKMFNMGDTIRDDTTFVSGELQYYHDENPPIGDHCYDDWGMWTSAGDKYFGVKFKTGTDSTYGWVKVNVGMSSCKIEEFSLAVALVGIESKVSNENYFYVYPNPSSGTIFLNISDSANFQNSTLTICNILGETVRKMEFSKTIDVSEFVKGCYFLELTFSDGMTTKTKFLKL